METILNKESRAAIELMVADGIITKDTAERYFPELKDSEDERIMGNIIATIHLYYGEPLEDEAKEMIAWLEAQGEQKSAEKFPKYKKGDILTDGKNKYEVLSWDYTETGIAAYYMKGVGCKFSWSCEEADKKLHLVEQKPDDTEKGTKGNEREIPISSWSEEDEEMLKMVIKSCEQCGNEYAYYWLKSLKDRYTWKPSDSQMGALWDSIKHNLHLHPVLESLYNDLKKLEG